MEPEHQRLCALLYMVAAFIRIHDRRELEQSGAAGGGGGAARVA